MNLTGLSTTIKEMMVFGQQSAEIRYEKNEERREKIEERLRRGA